MRRSFARLSVLATAATILVAPQTGAQATDPPGTLVIPPGVSLAYRDDFRAGFAATGVLTERRSDDLVGLRRWWTAPDGSTVDLGAVASDVWRGTGVDVMVKVPISGATEVEMRPLPSGAAWTIPLSGFNYRGAAERAVIASTDGTWSAGDKLYLLDVVSGSPRVREVTGLPDITAVVVGPGDANDVVVFTPNIAGLINLETAAYHELADLTGRGVTSLTPTHLVWRKNSSPAGYWAVARTGGTPVPLALPSTGGLGANLVGQVGDRFLAGFASSTSSIGRLVAAKADGANPQTLVERPAWLTPLADGTALAAGGLTPADRHVYRIAPGPSGDLTATVISGIPPFPAYTRMMTLAGRRLVTKDDSSGQVGWRDLGATGALVAGPRLADIPSSTFDSAHRASGGAGLAWKAGDVSNYLRVASYPGCCRSLSFLGTLNEIRTYSGRFLSYRSEDPVTATPIFVVINVDDGTHAYFSEGWDEFFGIWGSTLWTKRADFATSGVLVARSLRTGALIREVRTAARCAPGNTTGEVAGRWIFWACNGKLGVRDMVAGRDIDLTGVADVVNAGGEEKLYALADGFLVWFTFPPTGGATGTLKMIDLTKASPQAQVIADNVPIGKNAGWAVDQYGGQAVAYTTTDGSVHVVPMGIAASPVSLVDAEVRSLAGGWRPYWEVSKPATWQLTVSGATIGSEYTTSGTTIGTGIRPGLVYCNCVHSRRPVRYRLVVTPADGVGAPLVLTGSVPVQ